MSDSEYALLRDQLADVRADLKIMQGRMVTKTEWLPIKRQYEDDHERIVLHHQAYIDWTRWEKWVKRIGLATLASEWVSPHVVPIFRALGEFIKLVDLGGR